MPYSSLEFPILVRLTVRPPFPGPLLFLQPLPLCCSDPFSKPNSVIKSFIAILGVALLISVSVSFLHNWSKKLPGEKLSLYFCIPFIVRHMNIEFLFTAFNLEAYPALLQVNT